MEFNTALMLNKTQIIEKNMTNRVDFLFLPIFSKIKKLINYFVTKLLQCKKLDQKHSCKKFHNYLSSF